MQRNALTQDFGTTFAEPTEKSPLAAFLDKPFIPKEDNLREPKAVPLIFTELRSCCGTLYGYMDQFGNQFELDKETPLK